MVDADVGHQQCEREASLVFLALSGLMCLTVGDICLRAFLQQTAYAVIKYDQQPILTTGLSSQLPAAV